MPCARAQQNLSFEQVDGGGAPLDWSAGGGEVTTDGATAVAGGRSLKVMRAAADGVTRVTQRVPAAALRGGGAERVQRVRLAGFVRAEPAVAGALWLRIDGARGPLFVDSNGAGREPTEPESGLAAGSGASGWRRLEIELPLPDDVEEIAFGVSSARARHGLVRRARAHDARDRPLAARRARRPCATSKLRSP